MDKEYLIDQVSAIRLKLVFMGFSMKDPENEQVTDIEKETINAFINLSSSLCDLEEAVAKLPD